MAIKTATRDIRQELVPLGKALVRGTFKQIASSAFKCVALRIEFVRLVISAMVKEIIKLCSGEHPSISRNTSPQALIKLRIENVCEEWSVKAPIFYDFLKSAAIPSKRSDVA